MLDTGSVCWHAYNNCEIYEKRVFITQKMIKNTIMFCYLDSHLGSFHVCVFINFRFRLQSFKYKKSVICIWKVNLISVKVKLIYQLI